MSLLYVLFRNELWEHRKVERGGFGKQSVMMVTLVANNNTRGHVSAAVKVPQAIPTLPFSKKFNQGYHQY